MACGVEQLGARNNGIWDMSIEALAKDAVEYAVADCLWHGEQWPLPPDIQGLVDRAEAAGIMLDPLFDGYDWKSGRFV